MNTKDLPPALPPPVSWARASALGYGIVLFAVVGLGGWSAVAEIDSAVIAPGVVSAETNRQTVQHLEGGIVAEIRVRNGDRVEAGDVLVVLDLTEARSQLEVLRTEHAALAAREARLLAERDGAKEIAFPAAVLDRRADPFVARAIEDEVSSFGRRGDVLASQLDIITSRAEQLARANVGLEADIEASRQQIAQLDVELPGLRALLERGLVQLSRVTGLERERARLEGAVARAEAEKSRNAEALVGFAAEASELRQTFQRSVADDLVATRRQLAEIGERVVVAEDRLRRTDILAPQSGTVQAMRFFTVGGVVGRGEPILEIAPDGEPLVVQARIAPTDADTVFPGLVAEIRFPAFHSRHTPVMFGRLLTVSRDRIEDRDGPYFAGEVRIDEATVPPEIRGRLVAGMPADIIIATGQRTVLEYLISPLAEAARRAMREE